MATSTERQSTWSWDATGRQYHSHPDEDAVKKGGPEAIVESVSEHFFSDCSQPPLEELVMNRAVTSLPVMWSSRFVSKSSVWSRLMRYKIEHLAQKKGEGDHYL